jgi:aldose 1-epimerase
VSISKTGRRAAASALLVAALIAAPGLAATAQTAEFGTSAAGQVVHLITLRNDNGMSVRFSTRGGTITEILAPDRSGTFTNVVLGKADFAAWDRGGSFNSVVGRFANRIAGGGFTLDGTFYKLPANATTNIAIHGGPNGLANRLWTAKTFEQPGRSGAVLRYVSPDGDNGYPGELGVTMTYTLTNDNVLRLDYEAVTSKPTIINLTNHSYFAIGGYDSGPVYDQVMQVFAESYTPTDDKQIPTGEIAPVAGTPFDFRTPKRVGEALYSTHPQMLLARGLDHNFVLSGSAGGKLAVAARLLDPRSGRQMEVRTTEPGVQIYTANNFNGSQLGANGRTLRQSDGIAFETQHFPDSPNKPNFPNVVLRPGESFRSTTEYAFSTDARPFR